MTNTIKSVTIGATLGLVALAIGLFTIPALTHAADYAYVNTQGDVKSVTASDWMTAIAVAPGIAYNSGVYMLKSATDLSHLLNANK